MDNQNTQQDLFKFPKDIDQNRIDQYVHYDSLYLGEHFEAFKIKGEKDFSKQYNKLRYVVANFAGLMSRVMADMLFGEKATFEFKDNNNQKYIDSVIADNQLFTQLYESALANSRRGDSIFKLRTGQLQNNPSAPEQVIIEEVTPAIYFPVLDINGNRYKPKEDVLAWTFKSNGIDYLHREIHRPGYIFHEIYTYSISERKIIAQVKVEEFGFQEIEETGVDRSLIFHIPNVRDGTGFWGTSDYKDLEQLFFALNNRVTKIDNILDKHSDPILAVPPGVIGEDGKVKKEALGMFEVDNETPGFNKPEYIVWNANLESAEKEIEKLVEMLFLFSEISPASFGLDKNGQAESGRALKLKLIATIRKRNRKIRYYDQVLKDMFEATIQLARARGISTDGVKPGAPERPNIKWSDGVVNDTTEMVDIAVKRIDAGLSSKSDEIARLDDLTPEEAERKAKEIEKENAAVQVPSLDKSSDNKEDPEDNQEG